MSKTFLSSLTFAAAVACVAAAPAMATQYAPIRQAQSPALEAAMQFFGPLATKMDKGYNGDGGGTVFRAYHVAQITQKKPMKGHREKPLALFSRVIKAAMHRDYPITGDDGGYDLSNPKTPQELASVLDGSNAFSQLTDAEQKAAVAAMGNAIRSGLIIYAGTGSGNNTVAYIIAIVDPRTLEFFYLMDSNFGSDD